MTIREAVDRAMRGDRRVTPREFPQIQEALVETLSLVELQALAQSEPGRPVYLIRPEDAQILQGARFRNERERRDFYLGYLTQAKSRMLVEIVRAFREIPDAERRSTLACRRGGEEVSCFGEEGGLVTLWASQRDASPPAINGLLRFLGRHLPRGGFLGVSEATGGDLTGIQLLDGVMFTLENIGETSLPAETRISASVLRGLARTQIPDLP